MSPQPHILKQVRFFNISSPLLNYAYNVYSQNGEDGIIDRIIEVIGAKHKFCIEFGAWDGQYLSNCCNLVSHKYWSGAFIEGNPERFKDLAARYFHNQSVLCINSFVGLEEPDKLDNILERASVPRDFDILSIDIDGMDYFVWESLDEYSPRVVIVEFNPSIPNDVVFVQARDSTVNQGCSLLALMILAARKGYRLVCCTSINAFFVKKSLYQELKIESDFIYHLFQPSADGRIFHGYDSHIHVVGMPNLIWSNIAVTSEDFQVLPRSLQRYGDSQS